MNKRRELERISLKTEELMSYLVRLYLFDRSGSKYVWTLAAYESLHSVHRVGFLNRFPNSDSIYRATFIENRHLIRPMIETYKKIHRDDYYKDDIREVFPHKAPINMISRYLYKLSDKLAEDGCADFDEIERYLRLTGFIA